MREGLLVRKISNKLSSLVWKSTTWSRPLFSTATERPDPGSPRKNEKAKKFWSFVKSLKNDAFGMNTLRENGILKTDS